MPVKRPERSFAVRLVLALAATASLVVAAQAQSTLKAGKDRSVERICTLIQREAQKNGISPHFFARLIWKESRFDPDAVSPRGAQGIAQFMPETARSRKLDDPFDIEKAIPASAELLAMLRLQMGNFGLAAAAYNAGETRIDSWMNRGGFLPVETENYVLDITGKPADAFLDNRNEDAEKRLDDTLSFRQACLKLPQIRFGTTVMAETLTSPWAIQLAGNFRQSVARRSFDRIRARHKSLLADLPHAVSRQRSARGRAGIYVARVGAPDRAKANAICAALRAQGGACIVTKN